MLAKWKPGDTAIIRLHKRDRTATVLAVLDGRALIEYVMPAGWSGLRIVPEEYDRETGRVRKPHKQLSYMSLTRPWFECLIAEGRHWTNLPQQVRQEVRGCTPRQLYLLRFGNPEERARIAYELGYVPENNPKHCCRCRILATETEPLDAMGMCAWCRESIKQQTHFPEMPGAKPRRWASGLASLFASPIALAS